MRVSLPFSLLHTHIVRTRAHAHVCVRSLQLHVNVHNADDAMQSCKDRRARIALVNQHHADQIDMDETPLEFMANQFPGTGSRDHVDALRSHLSGCGIKAELQGVPTRALSGGQRSRVAMAAVSVCKRERVLLCDVRGVT